MDNRNKWGVRNPGEGHYNDKGEYVPSGDPKFPKRECPDNDYKGNQGNDRDDDGR